MADKPQLNVTTLAPNATGRSFGRKHPFRVLNVDWSDAYALESDSALMRAWWRVRRVMRLLVWRFPLLYAPVELLRNGRWLYSYRYDILIDGYPRSANTTTAEAFKLLLPGFRVASHRHAAPPVVCAIRNKIPTCLLIREPERAIASWIANYGCRPSMAIEAYIDYYTILNKYVPDVIVATFEEAISNFPELLRRMSAKFDFDHAPTVPSIFITQAIAARVQRISLPDDGRLAVIQAARERVLRCEYRPLMDEARRVYRDTLDARRG